MVELHSVPFVEEQAELLYDWTINDTTWQIEELGRKATKPDIVSYIQTYQGMGCSWQKWMQHDEPVAISCILHKAPSNGKSWIGTVVVNPKVRNNGVGQAVLSNHRKESDGVIFAGIPYARIEWSIFLGKCGFEQYGIEKDQGKEYLVMVHPK